MVKDKFPLRYQAKPFFVPGDLAKGLKVGDDEKALFLQEERRLCYVAMTRAQEKLYFTLAKRYGERKTDAKPSQFLFELDYQKNPLMEITQVIMEQQEGAEVPDNPVDPLKRKIKDQAHRAVEQMHLKTAIQRIVELEKIRLLEEGNTLESFDPAGFFSVPADDPALVAAFEQKPVPLIGDDHHFSASALKKYEDCPLCYKFLYVLQVPTLPQTYFSMGTAVHSVIEHLSKRQLEGETPTKERALALLNSCWSSEAYASRTHELEDRVKAEAMLDTYLAWQAANRNTIVATEKKFQFTLNGRKVKGSIDRIEQTPEGEYVVVDFKTGIKTIIADEEFCPWRYPGQPLLLSPSKRCSGNCRSGHRSTTSRMTRWSIISRPKRRSGPLQRLPERSSPQSVRNGSIRHRRSRPAGTAIMRICARRKRREGSEREHGYRILSLLFPTR